MKAAVQVQAGQKMTPVVLRSIHEYRRDVRRLLDRVMRAPSSYSAWLDRAGRDYPAFEVETPLGNVTVRVMGRAKAVVESDRFSIYGVSYRLFVHLSCDDERGWYRVMNVTGFEREDRNYQHDIAPASRRFDVAALPAISAFLDSLELVREAAQAVRLAWTISASLSGNLSDLDAMIAELSAARSAIADEVASSSAEITRIRLSLGDIAEPQ